jgi:hypothetical protein
MLGVIGARCRRLARSTDVVRRGKSTSLACLDVEDHRPIDNGRGRGSLPFTNRKGARINPRLREPMASACGRAYNSKYRQLAVAEQRNLRAIAVERPAHDARGREQITNVAARRLRARDIGAAEPEVARGESLLSGAVTTVGSAVTQ